MGAVLARKLILKLDELKWQVDVVIPVPLGPDRLAERGYNQAALLALPVALGKGWSYRPKALRRTRETQSQVGLSYDERQVNVLGAFEATLDLQGVAVVLIDDVATSGATLNACAAALRSVGARRAYCLTLARAL